MEFVHDMRSPLHSILSFSELGQRRIESMSRDKLLRYLEEIAKAGEQCLRLVNGAFDAKKCDVENESLNLQRHDLCDIVKSAINQMNPLIEDKGLFFSIQCQEGHCAILCDESQIMRLLTNLLSNAIKYSPQGGQCSVHVSTANQGTQLQVEVSDQGPGLTASELQHIFSPYQVGEGSLKDGLGLGLHIAKQVVEQHQGRIWAENSLLGGASFIFQIPALSVPQDQFVSQGVMTI